MWGHINCDFWVLFQNVQQCLCLHGYSSNHQICCFPHCSGKPDHWSEVSARERGELERQVLSDLFASQVCWSGRQGIGIGCYSSNNWVAGFPPNSCYLWKSNRFIMPCVGNVMQPEGLLLGIQHKSVQVRLKFLNQFHSIHFPCLFLKVHIARINLCIFDDGWCLWNNNLHQS